jgi:hypothetical protein
MYIIIHIINIEREEGERAVELTASTNVGSSHNEANTASMIKV